MLLRLSLAIAILAGAAALYFGHFKVAPGLAQLRTDYDTEKTAHESTRAEASAAKKAEREAKANLETANRELTTTKANLTEATSRLAEQERRANEASENLVRVTGERNEARQELNRWQAIGLTPDQIIGMRDRVQKVEKERDTFIAENKLMLRKLTQTEARLQALLSDVEPEIALPAGLKGKVVAVDPKFDFIVLNIGGEQGVLENGKMLVNRDGRLVAKVKITKVEPNRSIANILPEYKFDEVVEGDQVLY